MNEIGCDLNSINTFINCLKEKAPVLESLLYIQCAFLAC